MDHKPQTTEHKKKTTDHRTQNMNVPCSVVCAPFRRGFSLMEMLVSIAIFSFVMLATVSVLLSVVDANHKSQGIKTVMGNLSLTLESMARNLRTGSDYNCGSSTGGDCPKDPENTIFFKSHNGQVVSYCFLNDGAIRIGGDTCDASSDSMTAPEITIDRLDFYVNGTPEDNIQPAVLISVGGKVNSLTAVGAKARTTSRFDIQTFVSQRLPDVQ